MEIKAFKEIISQVQNYYGKEYNSIQLQEIYKYFQNVTEARFKFLVSKAYQNNTYLPSLAQLVDLQKNTPYAPKNSTVTNNKEKCKVCEDRGFILAPKIIDGFTYIYMFSCSCNKGKLYQYDGRKLKDEKLRSDYYIRPYLDFLKEKEEEEFICQDNRNINADYWNI